MDSPLKRQKYRLDLEELNCGLNRLTLFSLVPELNAVYVKSKQYIDWRFSPLNSEGRNKLTDISYLENLIPARFLMPSFYSPDIAEWIHRPHGDLEFLIKETKDKIKYLSDCFVNELYAPSPLNDIVKLSKAVYVLTGRREDTEEVREYISKSRSIDTSVMIYKEVDNVYPTDQIKIVTRKIMPHVANGGVVIIPTNSRYIIDTLNIYTYINSLEDVNFDIQTKLEQCGLEDLFTLENEGCIDIELSLDVEDLGIYYCTGDQVIEYDQGLYGKHAYKLEELETWLDRAGNRLKDFMHGAGVIPRN